MNNSRVLRTALTRFFTMLLLAGMPIVITSCDLARNALKPDRENSMEIQDYRDALAPRLPDVNGQSGTAGAEIPSLQPYVASGSETMETMPLVSISVNQTVPIRDVLFEIAKQADYDLELDPRIKGSIIFTARDRPLDEVVDRIAKVAGLRYTFENNILRVELDEPYNKVYKIDYLSYVRKNKGSIRHNLSVVKGDSADTGSDFEATGTSEADFWGELEVNIKQILGGTVSGAMKTKKDPRITAADQNPEVAPVAPTGEGGQPAAQGEGAPNVEVKPPDAVLKVESLPADEEEEDSSAAASAADGPGYTFTINKQAGLINVYASQKGQREVEAYLKMVRKAVTAQVLIEAKVLEVTLDDSHVTGINWSKLNALGGKLNVAYPDPASDFAGAENSFSLSYVTGDFGLLLEALSTFGMVKALASPRMTVLNNQSAVLNVATNRVFFDVDIDVTDATADTPRSVDVSSDALTVPVGVLVNVQPSINLDNGTIGLAVRPTVTRVENDIEDPAAAFAIRSADPPIEMDIPTVPELNVQEIDSIIQVRSGQPIVIGGLLQDRTESGESGVPVLSETPLVGALFRQHNDTIRKTELVIFLKATIIEAPEDTIHNTDKDLYRTFSGDRRPLKL